MIAKEHVILNSSSCFRVVSELFLLILLCKQVLKARDKLLRYGRATNSSMQELFIRKCFNAIVNQFDERHALFLKCPLND